MKISRPKTEKYHNWQDGNYKKGFWKKYDRKKFFRNFFKHYREAII